MQATVLFLVPASSVPATARVTRFTGANTIDTGLSRRTAIIAASTMIDVILGVVTARATEATPGPTQKDGSGPDEDMDVDLDVVETVNIVADVV